MKNRLLCKSAFTVFACSLLAWGVAVRREFRAALPPPQTHGEAAPDLASAINADFDGDQKPDLVTGSAVGDSYVLQIRFSSDKPTASLRVGGGVSGLRILSHDVNQDHDEDLIVTSCTSLIPVAVFLGDGKGHFQPGNPWNYIPVGINSSYSYDVTAGQTDPAGDTQLKRLIPGVLSEVFAQLPLREEPCVASGAVNPSFPGVSFGCTPRGPPADSPL
jgi:hypothetical protein